MYTNNLLLALGLAGSFAPAEAFFRMSCPGRIVRERLDPIVNPGGVSGHVHTISGGAGFSSSMTFEDARASKCSSCEIKVILSLSISSIHVEVTFSVGGHVQLLDSTALCKVQEWYICTSAGDWRSSGHKWGYDCVLPVSLTPCPELPSVNLL